MSEQITHTMELNATPSQVYQTLITSEKHTKLTGAPAEFEAEVGGAFSTFDGAITGKIAKLEEDKHIELDWRASGFPEGHYTKVVFDLEESEKGTTLKFRHDGVPDEALEMITKGWESNYWSNLDQFFSK